jgi:predicted transcriptional regulator
MQLTKAEEQIMQQLWSLRAASVQDIRERFGSDKPARTTIATILNILENKQFVTHTTDGRSNIYSPVVSKEDYSKKQLFGFLKDYFNGSFSSMASFFAKEANLGVEEMDALLKDIRRELKEEKETS